MLLGIKYTASEECVFQFDFEEWAISAHVAMCRSEKELAGAVFGWEKNKQTKPPTKQPQPTNKHIMKLFRI